MEEKFYARALYYALLDSGAAVQREKGLPLMMNGHIISNMMVDLMVDGIVVELKALIKTGPKEVAQTKRYIRATGATSGYLINFNEKGFDVKRINL